MKKIHLQKWSLFVIELIFLNSYGTEKESTSKRGQKAEVRLTSLWERSAVPTAFTIISLWTWSNLQKHGGGGRCTYQYNIWTRVTKLCQHPSNPIRRNPHSSGMASGWSDPPLKFLKSPTGTPSDPQWSSGQAHVFQYLYPTRRVADGGIMISFSKEKRRKQSQSCTSQGHHDV